MSNLEIRYWELEIFIHDYLSLLFSYMFKF